MTSANEQLYSAIASRNIASARAALSAGADPNALAAAGKSMLGYAVSEPASFELFRLLLDHGATASEANRAIHDPLYIAATAGNVAICKELIDRGAKIDRTNQVGGTALHVAAMNGRADVCQLLVDGGADVHMEGNARRVALHFASSSVDDAACLAIAKLFLSKGASSSRYPDAPHSGYLTPFQAAVQKGSVTVTRHLMEQCNEDPRQLTLDGRSMQELSINASTQQLILSAIAERSVDESIDTGPENVGATEPLVNRKTARNQTFGPL
jgi:ankyrin repeat protein